MKLRRLITGATLGAVLCVSGPFARAAVSAMPSVSYGVAGGTVSMGSLNTLGTGFRTVLGGAAGAAVITDVIEVAIAGGRVAMAAAAVVPWAGLAAAVAVAVAAGAGYVIGSLLYEEFIKDRCVAGSTGWFCDPGAPPESKPALMYSAAGHGWHLTPQAACSAAASAWSLSDQAYTSQGGTGTATKVGATWYCARSRVLAPTQWGTDNGYAGYIDKDTAPGFAIATQTETTMVCSDGSAPMRDGKCKTVADPRTQPQMAVPPSVPAGKVAQHPPADPVPYVKEALQGGASLDGVKGPTTVTGPATATVGSSTTSTYTPPATAQIPNPVPVVVTTPAPTASITYNGDTYTYTTTNTTVNAATGATTTTTGAPAATQELFTCGLPGKPACRIDETGTQTDVDAPASKITEALETAKRLGDDPKSFFPAMPDLNWTFTFPTGCAPVPMPGFAPYLDSIDVCRWQDLFHDVMSWLWTITGAFAAVRMVTRDATGG